MLEGDNLHVSEELKLARLCVDLPSRLKQKNTLSRVKVSYSIYSALATRFNVHPHVEDYIVAFGTEIPNVSAASPPAVIRRQKDTRDEHAQEPRDFGIYST